MRVVFMAYLLLRRLCWSQCKGRSLEYASGWEVVRCALQHTGSQEKGCGHYVPLAQAEVHLPTITEHDHGVEPEGLHLRSLVVQTGRLQRVYAI
jgi:hypothetical protein